MEGKSIQYRQRNRRNFSPSTTDEELEEIAASEEAIKEAMEVEDMFTKDEVARRSYEKAEKFRRDQAAQIRYVKEEGIKAMIIICIKQGPRYHVIPGALIFLERL